MSLATFAEESPLNNGLDLLWLVVAREIQRKLLYLNYKNSAGEYSHLRILAGTST